MMLILIELNCEFTGVNLENRPSYDGHGAAAEIGLLQCESIVFSFCSGLIETLPKQPFRLTVQ